MESPVRVRVLGDGLAAHRYIDAIPAVVGLDLETGSGATALILADVPDPQRSLDAARTPPDLPVLIDPSVVVTNGASERSRAWLRSVQPPAVVALPWREAPAVRLAGALLDATRFLHAHVIVSSDEPMGVVLFHLLDLITHLMDRSPERIYAEADSSAALEVEAPVATAGTLTFGAHGSAAFQVSRIDGPPSAPVSLLQLTDGTRRIALADFFASAELVGFDDEQVDAALPPELWRMSGRLDVVQSDWDLNRGLATLLADLRSVARGVHAARIVTGHTRDDAEAARAGTAPPGAPDLPSAVRTAALVRAALATQQSGKPQRLVTR